MTKGFCFQHTTIGPPLQPLKVGDISVGLRRMRMTLIATQDRILQVTRIFYFDTFSNTIETLELLFQIAFSDRCKVQRVLLHNRHFQFVNVLDMCMMTKWAHQIETERFKSNNSCTISFTQKNVGCLAGNYNF